MKSRIMYIERKAGNLTGEAWIGRVTFSKTMRSVHYKGKTYQKTKSDYKYNFFEVESGDTFWISGCKKNGGDRIYGETSPIYIDDDVRTEYWTEIREQPEFSHLSVL